MVAATITRRGAVRRPLLESYPTFDSRFDRGLDRSVWRDEGYPWIADAPTHGAQVAINEERQYYLRDAELLPHEPFRPVLVDERGLVLRCTRTPPAYSGFATAVIGRYRIVKVDVPGRRLVVEGEPYEDVYRKRAFVGIHRGLRNLPWIRHGHVMIGEYPVRLMYLRIVDHAAEDPLAGAGVRTTHEIELVDDIPDPAAIRLGRTRVSVLRYQDYVSGMATTRGGFAQTFGSWHVRMRMPAGRGTLAGILLWPTLPEPGADDAPRGPGDRAFGINLIEQPGHARYQYHSVYRPSTGSMAGGGEVPPSFLRPSHADGDVVERMVLMPRTHRHQVDFRTGLRELILDWYPDGTLVWSVQVPDGRFLEAARLRLPEGRGALDQRMLVAKLAFDSWFNRRCEERDMRRRKDRGKRDFRLYTEPPWEFVIEFIRVRQWDGYPSGTGAAIDDAAVDAPSAPVPSARVPERTS